MGGTDTKVEKGQEVLELGFSCSPWRTMGMQRSTCNPWRRPKLEQIDALEKVANLLEQAVPEDCTP